MTPKQAAKQIGCSPSHVRHLVRSKKLKATMKKIPGGFMYNIPLCEVLRYANKKQRGGWPRGQGYVWK